MFFRIRPLLAAATAMLALAAPFSRAQAASMTLDPVLTQADWVTTRASAASLAGKVVIVDVFTFGCINCKNITPNLKHIFATQSADVAIVGIQAPETPYEKVRANVVSNLREQGVVWPVRLDPDFAVWNAYGVGAWPTQLIFDRHGRLRKTIVGDSQDDAVNAAVHALIAER